MVFGLEKWSWFLWCWSSTLQSWRYHEPQRHWLHKNVQWYVKLHYFPNSNLSLFYFNCNFNLKLFPKFIAQYLSKIWIIFKCSLYTYFEVHSKIYSMFFFFDVFLKKMKCLIMMFDFFIFIFFYKRFRDFQMSMCLFLSFLFSSFRQIETHYCIHDRKVETFRRHGQSHEVRKTYGKDANKIVPHYAQSPTW